MVPQDRSIACFPAYLSAQEKRELWSVHKSTLETNKDAFHEHASLLTLTRTTFQSRTPKQYGNDDRPGQGANLDQRHTFVFVSMSYMSDIRNQVYPSISYARRWSMLRQNSSERTGNKVRTMALGTIATSTHPPV